MVPPRDVAVSHFPVSRLFFPAFVVQNQEETGNIFVNNFDVDFRSPSVRKFLPSFKIVNLKN